MSSTWTEVLKNVGQIRALGLSRPNGPAGKRRPMGGDRLQAQHRASLFRDLIYDRVVPADPFPRMLGEKVSRDRSTRKRVKCYRGKPSQGRPAYDPALQLKILLVAQVHNLYERPTEVVASDSLSVTGFLCLMADQAPPDLSTLTAFKRRPIDTGRVGTIEAMLADTVRLAREKRVAFGSIQVMGSVHTVAIVMEASQPERRAAKRARALRGAGISLPDWRGRRLTSASFPGRVFFHTLMGRRLTSLTGDLYSPLHRRTHDASHRADHARGAGRPPG